MEIDEEDGEFIFVKLRPKSFTKYIKCRKDIDRPGWFKCSNRLLEDDDLNKFSAAETCVWLKILSLSSEQQSALVRINLLKINALVRKFTLQDLLSAIEKLKALGILKTDVTRTLRGRNVDVTQRGEDRIGEEKKREEEERAAAQNENPPASVSASPSGGKFKSAKDLLAAIPQITRDAWLVAHGLALLESATGNAFAYHSTRPESADWEICTWASKINSAIEYAKAKAPPPIEIVNSEPRARAAPVEIDIPILTQQEVLNSAANAARMGLKLAVATIEKQVAGIA